MTNESFEANRLADGAASPAEATPEVGHHAGADNAGINPNSPSEPGTDEAGGGEGHDAGSPPPKRATASESDATAKSIANVKYIAEHRQLLKTHLNAYTEHKKEAAHHSVKSKEELALALGEAYNLSEKARGDDEFYNELLKSYGRRPKNGPKMDPAFLVAYGEFNKSDPTISIYGKVLQLAHEGPDCLGRPMTYDEFVNELRVTGYRRFYDDYKQKPSPSAPPASPPSAGPSSSQSPPSSPQPSSSSTNSNTDKAKPSALALMALRAGWPNTITESTPRNSGGRFTGTTDIGLGTINLRGAEFQSGSGEVVTRSRWGNNGIGVIVEIISFTTDKSTHARADDLVIQAFGDNGGEPDDNRTLYLDLEDDLSDLKDELIKEAQALQSCRPPRWRRSGTSCFSSSGELGSEIDQEPDHEPDPPTSTDDGFVPDLGDAHCESADASQIELANDQVDLGGDGSKVLPPGSTATAPSSPSANTASQVVGMEHAAGAVSAAAGSPDVPPSIGQTPDQDALSPDQQPGHTRACSLCRAGSPEHPFGYTSTGALTYWWDGKPHLVHEVTVRDDGFKIVWVRDYLDRETGEDYPDGFYYISTAAALPPDFPIPPLTTGNDDDGGDDDGPGGGSPKGQRPGQSEGTDKPQLGAAPSQATTGHAGHGGTGPEEAPATGATAPVPPPSQLETAEQENFQKPAASATDTVAEYCASPIARDKDRIKKYGEIFTPLKVVNAMLDHYPIEDWSNYALKFEDTACGDGNFLIEVHRRLMVGLQSWQANNELRHKHIIESMIYGIDIQGDLVEATIERLRARNFNHNIRCADTLLVADYLDFVFAYPQPFVDALTRHLQNTENAKKLKKVRSKISAANECSVFGKNDDGASTIQVGGRSLCVHHIFTCGNGEKIVLVRNYTDPKSCKAFSGDNYQIECACILPPDYPTPQLTADPDVSGEVDARPLARSADVSALIRPGLAEFYQSRPYLPRSEIATLALTVSPTTYPFPWLGDDRVRRVVLSLRPQSVEHYVRAGLGNWQIVTAVVTDTVIQIIDVFEELAPLARQDEAPGNNRGDGKNWRIIARWLAGDGILTLRIKVLGRTDACRDIIVADSIATGVDLIDGLTAVEGDAEALVAELRRAFGVTDLPFKAARDVEFKGPGITLQLSQFGVEIHRGCDDHGSISNQGALPHLGVLRNQRRHWEFGRTRTPSAPVQLAGAPRDGSDSPIVTPESK